MGKLRTGTAALLWVTLAGVCSAGAIQIELAHGTDGERQTKEQLERVLSTHDFSKYTFTDKVVIEEKAIPHSHPVLTLNTRHLDSDDVLLSSYAHEQLHWFLAAHEDETHAAIEDLRKIYRQVPDHGPEGARDEMSTYLHLIVCYLELQADRDLLGAERTRKVMEYLSGDHYTWVYKTVLADEKTIAAVVKKHGLVVR